MRVQTLNDLNLNDSMLLGADVSWNQSSVILTLRLDYMINYEGGDSVPCKLKFHECAALVTTIRLWIGSCESIHSGETLSAVAAREFLDRVQPLGQVPDDMSVHRVETATTASEIMVACRYIELLMAEEK